MDLSHTYCSWVPWSPHPTCRDHLADMLHSVEAVIQHEANPRERFLSWKLTVGTETKRYALNVKASSWGFGSLLISWFVDSRVFYLEWFAAIRSFYHSCLCTRVCTLKFQANKTKIFILLLKPTPIWSQPSGWEEISDTPNSYVVILEARISPPFRKEEIILDQTRFFFTQSCCKTSAGTTTERSFFITYSVHLVDWTKTRGWWISHKAVVTLETHTDGSSGPVHE